MIEDDIEEEEKNDNYLIILIERKIFFPVRSIVFFRLCYRRERFWRKSINNHNHPVFIEFFTFEKRKLYIYIHTYIHS